MSYKPSGAEVFSLVATETSRMNIARLGKVILLLTLTAGAFLQAAETAPAPVKVFILAGQSNMEGKAKMELLKYQIDAPETRDFFKHLHDNGKFIVRDDVWIKFLDRHGKHTVGFGSPGCIGPELEFGNAVGNALNEQVLLIKTAWGGRSLGRDFRSPGAGLPSNDYLQKKLDESNTRTRQQNEKVKDAEKKKPEMTLEQVKEQYGKSYREMLAEIQSTLKSLPQLFPDYKGQGYEIAGFVWFQGWNDLFDPEFTDNYAANMAHFIRDVRKDLGVSKLPVVIGQMGQDGVQATGAIVKIKAAQASIETMPEFAGNVKVVKTDVFWDLKAAALVAKWKENKVEWDKTGSDYGYHYLGSAITFSKIGRAMGDAMLELRK